MDVQLSRDEWEYIQRRRERERQRQGEQRPRQSWGSRLFWGILSLVLVLGLAILVADRVLPGAPGAILGQVMVRLGVPGTLTINGTPVAGPTPLSQPTAVLSPPVSPQGYSQQPPVVQQVQVPIVQTVVVPAPTATPVPAGVNLSVSGQGAQLSVSNGSGAPPAAEPPVQPQAGQPGFVQSFVEPPTLAPGNPFVGCLRPNGCNPNAPQPTRLPAPGESGFVESFKEP